MSNKTTRNLLETNLDWVHYTELPSITASVQPNGKTPKQPSYKSPAEKNTPSSDHIDQSPRFEVSAKSHLHPSLETSYLPDLQRSVQSFYLLDLIATSIWRTQLIQFLSSFGFALEISFNSEKKQCNNFVSATRDTCTNTGEPWPQTCQMTTPRTRKQENSGCQSRNPYSRETHPELANIYTI